MNLIEKTCKELGVEVGEVWLGNDGFRYCVLSNADIERYEEETHDGYLTLNIIWKDILAGKLKPVWKPKQGEGYYCPRTDLMKGWEGIHWADSSTDNHRLNNNLVFKTKEEAIECTNKMLEAIKED